MAPEALWRRMIEVNRHVGDRQSRVLEQARRAHEAGHGEVSLGRWQSRAKEAADQRAGPHAKLAREVAHGVHRRAIREERLDKAPEVFRCVVQARDEVRRVAHRLPPRPLDPEDFAELRPSRGKTNVDELAQPTVPKGQQALRRQRRVRTHQHDRRHPGKFAHQSHGTREVGRRASRGRHEDATKAALRQIAQNVLRALPVQGPIRAGARPVDFVPFLRLKNRGHRADRTRGRHWGLGVRSPGCSRRHVTRPSPRARGC